MSSEEELRERIDLEGGQKRYPNASQTQTPDDIDDPTQRRDGTTPTLWERAKESYLYFITLFSAVIAVGIVSVAFGVQLIPELLTNMWLLGGIGLAILITVVFVIATNSAYSRLLSLDWFVGISGTGIYFYVGEFVPGGRDQSSKFRPYKGFSLFGQRREPYSVEEINPDAAQTWKNPGVEPDDPASINIDEAPGGVVRSDYGTIIGRWMGGIEVQTGGEAQLRITPPDEVDSAQYNMLTDQLLKKTRRERRLEEELDACERYIENELDNMKKPIDQQIDKEIERVGYLTRVGTQPRRQQNDTPRLSDVDGIASGDDLAEFAPDAHDDGGSNGF